jgi:hypothetical protein
VSINHPKDLKGKDVATQIALDGLTSAQQNTRDQLAILRQTRGQRQVGELKIPVHLQTPIDLGSDLVKAKPSRAGGDE